MSNLRFYPAFVSEGTGQDTGELELAVEANHAFDFDLAVDLDVAAETDLALELGQPFPTLDIATELDIALELDPGVDLEQTLEVDSALNFPQGESPVVVPPIVASLADVGTTAAGLNDTGKRTATSPASETTAVLASDGRTSSGP